MQKNTLFKQWKENFGKGVYVLVILAMTGFVVQIAATVVVALMLRVFPELDYFTNSGLATFLGVLCFVIAGVPLFGFLFTHFYEREIDNVKEDVETGSATRQSSGTK